MRIYHGSQLKIDKDINRAEAGSLLKLARTLGCEMEDLLEPQGKER